MSLYNDVSTDADAPAPVDGEGPAATPEVPAEEK